MKLISEILYPKWIMGILGLSKLVADVAATAIKEYIQAFKIHQILDHGKKTK